MLQKKIGRQWAVFVVFSAVFFFTAAGFEDSGDQRHVEGVVLTSFSDPHVLLQTDGYMVRILINKLDDRHQQLFQKIGTHIATTIPREAVDMVWAIENDSQGYLQMDRAKPEKDFLVHSRKGHQDSFFVRGLILPSFSVSHSLVKVGKYIYRINRDKLNEKERTMLETKSGRIGFEIPVEAVEFSWKAEPEEYRTLASIRENAGKVTQSGDTLKFNGVAVSSFSEPHFLLQSGGSVYMIRKDAVSDKAARSLASVGSSVSVSIPLSSIEFAWSVLDESEK